MTGSHGGGGSQDRVPTIEAAQGDGGSSDPVPRLRVRLAGSPSSKIGSGGAGGESFAAGSSTGDAQATTTGATATGFLTQADSGIAAPIGDVLASPLIAADMVPGNAGPIGGPIGAGGLSTLGAAIVAKDAIKVEAVADVGTGV